MYFKTLLLSLVISFPAFSQAIFLNPSFEGTPHDGSVPNLWATDLGGCGGFSTPDIQPGFWGCNLPPHGGNSYMGMIARPNDTHEGIYQLLAHPFQKGTCYAFTIYLARAPAYDVYTEGISLEIWGSNNVCEEDELLWKSPQVNHTDWQPYAVHFSPLGAYKNVVLMAVGHQGNILVDDIRDESLITPQSPLKPDAFVCQGETLTLDSFSSHATAYQWSTGATTSSIVVSDSGRYTVAITFPECSATFSENVHVVEKPQVRLPADTTLYVGSAYEIVAITLPDQAAVNWSTGDVSPSIVVTTPGEYFATLVNDCGEGEDTIMVSSLDLLIPNVVTDNTDSKNDFFTVQGLAPHSYGLKIYNRWGDVIFYANPYENNWPDKSLDESVYYYELDLHGKIFRGMLQLMR
jgi:gliding motility-associated-like protein